MIVNASMKSDMVQWYITSRNKRILIRISDKYFKCLFLNMYKLCFNRKIKRRSFTSKISRRILEL